MDGMVAFAFDVLDEVVDCDWQASERVGFVLFWKRQEWSCAFEGEEEVGGW